jgi:hypothetical protein
MFKMMRFATVMALTAGLAACEAQCSVSSAGLSEESMANAVNQETKAPVAMVTSFAPDASVIYATAKLSNAPENTKVKATFYYLEGGDRQIAEHEVTAEGTRYVMFTLTPPTNGWPAGQYETRFFLNGKEGKHLPFNVAAKQAPAVSAPPAAPADPATPARPAPPATPTRQFHDNQFGFTLVLPDRWTYRVTPQKHYLFEGPKGTDAYELSVILQFVAKSANPGSTPAAQLQGLAAGLARAPNGAIGTRGSVNVGGQPAPFFNATYDAKNSTGELVPFTHTQVAVDHGEYYYLISYSGPTAVFKKYLPVFEHLVTSLVFTS